MICVTHDLAVSLRIPDEHLADVERLLGAIPKAMPGVLSRALNRTAMTLRSRVAKDASKQLEVPQREIKKRVTLTWARRDNLSARVRIRDWGFSLFFSRPRQTPIGVQLTKGTRELIAHAFIAVLRKARWKELRTGEKRTAAASPGENWQVAVAGQQYPGVYMRIGRARFPVRALRTKGVIEQIEKAGGWERHYDEALDTLHRRLRHEIEFILEVAGGKWTAGTSRMEQKWEEWRSEMAPEEFR